MQRLKCKSNLEGLFAFWKGVLIWKREKVVSNDFWFDWNVVCCKCEKWTCYAITDDEYNKEGELGK